MKGNTDGHREEVLNSLTRVIGAINIVKDLVPLEIGKTILSAASTILLAVKVNLIHRPKHVSERPTMFKGYNEEQRRLPRSH